MAYVADATHKQSSSCSEYLRGRSSSASADIEMTKPSFLSFSSPPQQQAGIYFA
jgi:hypothetical protein